MENAPRPAQPALLSDSGVFPIPSRQRRKALPRVYRLLLAEDDADTVNLYQMVFADGTDDAVQYHVTVARTARECIERLRAAQTPFDLLVMDLGIAEPHDAAPERHLLPWLHAHADLRPPRVLVVSGFSGYQLHARMADLRALNAVYLPKPFDVDEMLAAVRALCEGDTSSAGGVRFAPDSPA
jgi:DNA-binding NarL/FixJ family response regulator